MRTLSASTFLLLIIVSTVSQADSSCFSLQVDGDKSVTGNIYFLLKNGCAKKVYWRYCLATTNPENIMDYAEGLTQPGETSRINRIRRSENQRMYFDYKTSYTNFPINTCERAELCRSSWAAASKVKSEYKSNIGAIKDGWNACGLQYQDDTQRLRKQRGTLSQEAFRAEVIRLHNERDLCFKPIMQARSEFDERWNSVSRTWYANCPHTGYPK